MVSRCIVDASALGPYATKSLSGGPSALERCLKSMAAVKGADSLCVLLDQGQEGLRAEIEGMCGDIALPLDLRSQPMASVQGVLRAMEAAAAGASALLYIRGDAAFVNPALGERLVGLTKDYGAEYAFADGYPDGYAPEALQPSLIPSLLHLAGATEIPLGRDWIFKLLERDLNGFDLETEVAPFDYRAYRLSLRCSRRSEYLVCQALEGALRAQPDAGQADILDIVRGQGQLLRGLPGFFYIQVSAACPQSCEYCPYPKAHPDHREDKGRMALTDFSRLVAKIADYSPDAVLSPSLWGEPSLHPDILGIAVSVLERPGLGLLIETSGIGWQVGILEAMSALPGADRVNWVVSLDAHKPETYSHLRGQGFEEAKACFEKLLGLFPGRAYLQAVRLRENEEELEEFYKYWRPRWSGEDRLIVQKYDHFAGFLPQRKLSDLSPLDRGECWHLKRDMCVLLDGSVPLCREDIGGSPMGNALNEDLAEIWSRMLPRFCDHLERRFNGPCRECDEYYTYNF